MIVRFLQRLFDELEYLIKVWAKIEPKKLTRKEPKRIPDHFLGFGIRNGENMWTVDQHQFSHPLI